MVFKVGESTIPVPEEFSETQPFGYEPLDYIPPVTLYPYVTFESAVNGKVRNMSLFTKALVIAAVLGFSGARIGAMNMKKFDEYLLSAPSPVEKTLDEQRFYPPRRSKNGAIMSLIDLEKLDDDGLRWLMNCLFPQKFPYCAEDDRNNS